MPLANRSLRRSVLCLLGMVCTVCAAQSGNQFTHSLSPTSISSSSAGSPVVSLLTGDLQGPSPPTVDILYVDTPTTVTPPHTTVIVPAVIVGEELNTGNGEFQTVVEDNITFTGATSVVAALPTISGQTDYFFAITGPTTDNLCLYYGTGYTYTQLTAIQGYSTYKGGAAYPASAPSSCITVPAPTGGSPPSFTAIAVLYLSSGPSPQLLVEDSANNLLDIVSVNGPNGFAVDSTIPIPRGDEGPIYTGDLNGDGNTDFIVNGQSSHDATVYLSNGTGGFTASAPYTFDNGVYSMLLQDMDGATNAHGPIQDMVVEGSNGAIDIFPGNGDGTFKTTSEGGTGAAGASLTGDGGHLAAIDPNTLNILATTPIGLSVLQPQSPGSLNYTLKNIYNIGPGRSSFALANFRGGGILYDLAVNSPEGVAIAQSDGNGGFLSSLAYSTLAPALGATVGQFRNSTYNPSGILDVVAATGATQAQLLLGNGIGASTFTAAPAPTNTSSGPGGIPRGLWSNIVSGDFNGDGNLDLAYSLTGLPPLPATGSGLYVQYGNGEGTFGSPVTVTGVSGGNTLYGESAAGFFDNTGIADIANADASYDDTLLGQTTGGFNAAEIAASSNTGYNQVAAGYFKTPAAAGQPINQDLVFQQGASLVPYKNNDDGTGKNFMAMTALAGPNAAQYAAGTVLLTDIDGDGNGDIVVLYHNLASNPANPSPSTPNLLYIWWGNGNGAFNSTPYALQLSRNYYLAAVADMNNDGYPDLVLSDGYLVGILYNQGQATAPNYGRSFSTEIDGVEVGVEQQFLAGQGINSLSLVKLGGAITPSLIVANGGASISNPVALEGETPAPSGLTPNPPDVNTGGITVLANTVATTPVQGSLTSSLNPSTVGAAFTMTATFRSFSGVPEPTGSVAFYLAGDVVACSPYSFVQGQSSSPSTATCVVPAGVTTAVGTYPISAAYLGDSNNSPLTAANTQTIAADQTTTTLFLCVGPTAPCPSTGIISPAPPYMPNLTMIYGQTFNGITGVTASNPSTLLGTTVLNDVYNGVLLGPLCTLQTLSSNPCPPSVGTGTQAGVNVFTSSYVPGTLDTINGPSTSPPVTITVTPDTVNASVAGSPSTAPVGQPVTLTATLAGVNAPLGTATSPVGFYLPPPGAVVFMDGSTPITCSAPTTLTPSASGVTSTATCTTSTLPVGTDPITVSYAGSLDFLPTTSTTPFNETIAPLAAPSFTLAVTPNPATVTVGFGTVLTVTVTAQNGFSEGVDLACGTLPSETTCTFTQPAIAGGGGQSNLILETTAPHGCDATQPYFFGGSGGAPGLAPLALPALAGLFALFIPGRRRWLRALLAVLLTATVAQIAGCGTCTDLGTRPNTYTIQVIGTSTVTGQAQSQALTLNATI